MLRMTKNWLVSFDGFITNRTCASAWVKWPRRRLDATVGRTIPPRYASSLRKRDGASNHPNDQVFAELTDRRCPGVPRACILASLGRAPCVSVGRKPGGCGRVRMNDPNASTFSQTIDRSEERRVGKEC